MDTANLRSESKRFFQEILENLTPLRKQNTKTHIICVGIEVFLSNYDTRFPEAGILKEEARKDARKIAWAKKNAGWVFHICGIGKDSIPTQVIGTDDACALLDMHESVFRARLSKGRGCFQYQDKIVKKFAPYAFQLLRSCHE